MVFNSGEYSVSAVIFCSDIILSNGEGHIANHTRPLNKKWLFPPEQIGIGTYGWENYFWNILAPFDC